MFIVHLPAVYFVAFRTVHAHSYWSTKNSNYNSILNISCEQIDIISTHTVTWGKIQTKVLRFFRHGSHSHLYSFALRFFISSNSRNLLQFYSSVTVNCKGERRKTYGLRNPYINLKSENSQAYARKPQSNCTFMNSASE